MTTAHRIAWLIAIITLAACSGPHDETEMVDLNIDEFASDYLFLELAMAQHDAAHVDAYFGPESIRAEAESAALSLQEIAVYADDLAIDIETLQSSDASPRTAGLLSRLQSLKTRIAINEGKFPSFDEETMQLFNTTAPTYDASHFDDILKKIDALLPGEGTLSERVDVFKQQYAIPPEKLSDVFDAAIAECRRRTLRHIVLPANETFTIEYVNDKPWSGYNWYQGDAVSVIQINTDLPIFISRAVDLGCHEGYPGHHTFNALLEKNLVVDKQWQEFSLYPLFSAQSVIAEGSGNYGIDLAFPNEERRQFEQDVLFPLADLETSNAARYYELQGLLAQLNYAGNEAARAYLNGDYTREQAVDWLMKYSLSSRERAEQRTRFFDNYRSYVINYNHGKDLVRQFVERNDADLATRWQRFEAMLSSPVLPSDLE